MRNSKNNVSPFQEKRVAIFLFGVVYLCLVRLLFYKDLIVVASFYARQSASILEAVLVGGLVGWLITHWFDDPHSARVGLLGLVSLLF